MPESLVYNDKWENILPQYPDNYFDWVFDDVPYGLNVGNMNYLSRESTVKQKNGSRLNPRKNRKKYKLKDWDTKAPGQEYFNEICRVSKNQFIFGIEYMDWEGVGPGRFKWYKGIAEGMNFKEYELAYCSAIDYTREYHLLWSGMMQAKSLAEPMTQQGNKKLNEVRIHPCQKPRLLYRRLFTDYTKPGMKILDSHLGSGSSRIEADMAQLNFVGCEVDRDYYFDQEIRYRQYKQQLKLNI